MPSPWYLLSSALVKFWFQQAIHPECLYPIEIGDIRWAGQLFCEFVDFKQFHQSTWIGEKSTEFFQIRKTVICRQLIVSHGPNNWLKSIVIPILYDSNRITDFQSKSLEFATPPMNQLVMYCLNPSMHLNLWCSCYRLLS